jgi:hypothetical protein
MNFHDPLNNINEMKAQQAKDAIAAMLNLMSGNATYNALQNALEQVNSAVSETHIVRIEAFNITVTAVRFEEPHTLVLDGYDESGNTTKVIAHYSQIVAHISSKPKPGLDQ